jgi:hypothetical protein
MRTIVVIGIHQTLCLADERSQKPFFVKGPQIQEPAVSRKKAYLFNISTLQDMLPPKTILIVTVSAEKQPLVPEIGVFTTGFCEKTPD